MRKPRLYPGVFVLALLLPLLLLACGGSDEPAEGPSSDREALVALYNAAAGPNWNSNNNWLTDVPIGEWSGVTTDDNGHVTELDLVSNQLSGEIPLELGSFASLTDLLLFGNQLSGEIPPELGNVASLRWMNLGGNQLSGEIPPELGKLANLEWLGLAENRLSGEIPSELGKLASLEYLDLDGNQFGSIPVGGRIVR